MSSMGSPPEPAVPAYRRLRMPGSARQVLGVDLNRSESSRQPACPSLPPPTLGKRRHRGLARRLVAPTPSMRFVSAHFGAQTGRCRGPCQLKTSQQQASQQLRHHFVAVQAFAFACPKVPGRVGPFLRSPFLSPCETRQNCRCSTDRRGTNVGFLDWGR
jgi:hypothetical protein